LWDDLLQALFHGGDIVRGHAADAVERVSRRQPGLLRASVHDLASQARRDPVPMVRWHLAMVLANLAYEKSLAAECTQTMLALLEDGSPFVRSWAISGLCQVGRLYPARGARVLSAIARLKDDPSIAVRHRAAKAVSVLTDPRHPLPTTWVKRKG
jgi:HEAT repeat protein